MIKAWCRMFTSLNKMLVEAIHDQSVVSHVFTSLNKMLEVWCGKKRVNTNMDKKLVEAQWLKCVFKR